MESSHLSHSRLEEQENAYSYHNNNNGTSKVVKVSLSMSVSESQTWKRKTTVSTSSQLASSMDLRSHCEEGVCLAGEGLTACSHAHRHRSAKTVTPPPPPVTESAAVHQTRHSKKTEANSTSSSSTNVHSIYVDYLNQSSEERDRSKTDYTYAHSYSYSPFVSTKERNNWRVPNMSRQSTRFYQSSGPFLNKDLMTQKTSTDYANDSMSLNRSSTNNYSTTTRTSSVRNGRRYSFTTDDEDDDEMNSITKTTFATLSSNRRKCLAWSAVFLFLPILLSSGAYWYMLSTGGTFGQTLHDMSSSTTSRFASIWDSISFGYQSPNEMSNFEDLTQPNYEIQLLREEIERMKAFQKAETEKQSASSKLPAHSPLPSPSPSPNYDEVLERLERLELRLTSCCKKNTNLTQIIESEVKHIVDSKLSHFQTKYYHQLELEIDKAKTAMLELVREQATNYSLNKPSGAFDAADVETMIRNAITKYDADKTGEADYALESSGAWIINTRCSETYEVFSATYKLFGLTLWKSKTTPRTVIQSGVVPGECWCFKGSEGRIGIHLAARIIPTSFSYEHIPVSISRDGHIQSAPANFAVYGLNAEDDVEPALLGEYRYQIGENDQPLQRFEVSKTVTALQTFKYVELVVKSNHGHPEYTCLYRFRVHGKPVFDEEA